MTTHTFFYVNLDNPSLPQDFKDAFEPACSLGEGEFYYYNTRFGLDRGLGLNYAHLFVSDIPNQTPEVFTQRGIPINSIWIHAFTSTSSAQPGHYYKEVTESNGGLYKMTVNVASPLGPPVISAIGQELGVLVSFLNEVMQGLLEPNG